MSLQTVNLKIYESKRVSHPLAYQARGNPLCRRKSALRRMRKFRRSSWVTAGPMVVVLKSSSLERPT
jgi:hypothetical protein